MDNKEKKPIRRKRKKSKLWLVIIVIIAALAVCYFVFGFGNKNNMAVPGNIIAEATSVPAERRSIQTTLSSSGTLKPADEYDITAQVGGDVLESFFEEGDVVTKDQLLYVIDSSDMESSIERAQNSYDKTKRSYDKLVESFEDLNVYSDYDGIITEVMVEEGDSIQSGAVIASLRDSSIMHLLVPFAAADVTGLHVGQKGSAVIEGSFESFECTIEEIDSFVSVLDERAVKYVKVKVNNPSGTIFNITKATVSFGDTVCLEAGTFEYNKETQIRCESSGEVVSVIKRGEKVSAGSTLVCKLESESLEDSLKDMEESLEDAQSSLEDTIERVDDYSIKAPITGTVIEKYSKVGDTLDSTKGQTSMAKIYDMSYLEFEMALDELDISRVKEGQKVVISCDAISLKNIEGVISEVSIVGTTSYNSTTYPVTVRIDNPPQGLLPGMNVDAELVVEEAENVLTVPTASLQRGNIVYVQYDGAKPEGDNAPEGYKSVEVETGISNESYIEIKDGGELKEGDIVYVPQVVRESSGDMIVFGGMGAMGGMGMGGMPSGGMPGGNMGGQRPTGGGMPGGMR